MYIISIEINRLIKISKLAWVHGLYYIQIGIKVWFIHFVTEIMRWRDSILLLHAETAVQFWEIHNFLSTTRSDLSAQTQALITTGCDPKPEQIKLEL